MTTAALAIARRLASALPFWAWLLLAALAWGGWQRHGAKRTQAVFAEAKAQAASEREADLLHAVTETARRLAAQKEITNAADQTAAQAQADAASAAAAARSLRARIAAVQARAAASNPASALNCASAEARARVFAELFERADERAGKLGQVADERRAAGESCERSYDSLSPP